MGCPSGHGQGGNSIQSPGSNQPRPRLRFAAHGPLLGRVDSRIISPYGICLSLSGVAGLIEDRRVVLADESSTKSGVQSVERAFELLEIMASSGGSMALGELAARAELPQPTIHRLVRTLLVMGYVRQLENRRYALGPKLIRLGESAAQLIGAWSRPHLTELVARTGESANMAVLDNDMAVYVAQVPSPHAMRDVHRSGSAGPPALHGGRQGA